MPNHLCQITDAEAGVVSNPALLPNFVNPNYQVPIRALRPNFSLQIFAGETGHQFNPHYEAGSGEGEGVYGSRGFCTFVILDDDKDKFNLPFIPVRFQRVLITDDLGEVFTGFVQNVRRDTLGYRKDGTALQRLIVECEDYWGFLEQETYNEFYTQKKAGYILRDAFSRAGFDVSDIDPELGPVFKEYPVIELYPADVINDILGLMDYTFWIDRVTLKPSVFPRDASQAELFTVTDDNWTKLFDDLDIEEDLTGFANEIIVSFLEKYSQGTANFEQGSDVVLGYSGDEGWVYLPRVPLSIQNQRNGSIYSISLNNSEDEETNELILESQYKEITELGEGTNVPYIITGAKNKVRARNSTSIDEIKALKGGSGRIVKKVVLDNVPLSKGEANLVAKAELAIAMRPQCIGSGQTISQKLRGLITQSGAQEGRTIRFVLTQTKGLNVVLRIESFKWKDNSTPNLFAGMRLQGFDYSLEFTPSTTREQLRELSKKLVVTGATTGDDFILDSEIFTNIVAFKDCVTPVEALKQADASIFEADDLLTHREVETKMYYFAPAVTHPDSEAHFVGRTKYSNFS